MASEQPTATSAGTQELLVAACGLTTSLVVVGLDWLLKRYVGFNFPSVMHWFVIPTGALATGMGAASGYYLGAKHFHQMPSPRLAFNMIAIGASTWLLMAWTDYRTATFSDTGGRIADALPFAAFVRESARSMSYSVGTARTSTGELGTLGYWLMGWQFLAFMAGGAAVYLILRAQRACVTCRRYFKRRYLLPETTAAAFDDYLEKHNLHLPDVASMVREVLGTKPFRGIALSVDQCPTCSRTELVVEVGHGRDQSDFVTAYKCDLATANALPSDKGAAA